LAGKAVALRHNNPEGLVDIKETRRFADRIIDKGGIIISITG